MSSRRLLLTIFLSTFFIYIHITTADKSEKQNFKSYDEIISFGMFENFELCLEKFKLELQLLQKLRNIVDNQSNLKSTETALEELKTEISNLVTSQHDLEDAEKGLIYLHNTYKTSVSAMNHGFFQAPVHKGAKLKLQANHSLDVDDLYRLTKRAFSFKWYDVAMDFLRPAMKLAKEKKTAVSDKARKRMEKMGKDLVMLNNKLLDWHRRSVSQDFKIYPYMVSSHMKPLKSQPDFVRSGQVDLKRDHSRQTTDAELAAVCRENFTYPNRAEIFQCKLLHHNDPYLKLGPFKIEEVSRSPVMIQVRDFLTEKEIDYLIDYARPRLSKARADDQFSRELERNNPSKKTRIIQKSVQAWIPDLTYDKYYDNLHELETNFSYKIIHPVMFRVSKRIELVTRLNATAKYAASEFQVTSYGLGGLCETHLDPYGYIEGVELPPYYLFQRLKKQGDMVATVMGWLEDVIAGGATAFVNKEFNRLLWPEKGSVAIWINLDRKGYRDRRLHHGGCPVISGTKWTLNKWLYFFDQFQNLPCALNSQEMASPFTGYY